MSEFLSLPFNKKLNLLRAHCFDEGEWKDLDHEKWCLHCGKNFSGHAVRVWRGDKGNLLLACGTPECGGSPIDWAEYPWWDEKHPATKAYLKKRKTPRRSGKSRRKTTDLGDDVPF